MKQASSPISAIFKLLLKWWWLIALSVALGVGVGYFVHTKQPNVYVATTRVLFGQNFTSSQTASIASLGDLKDMIQIYSGLVRLPTVLGPVIDDLGLGVSVGQLNGMMTIVDVENLPILEISIADTRPDRAANIANRIAQELITQSPAEQVSQETAFKREQLANIQKQIEELQGQYDANIAQGATLTSAFEITQNLNERSGILQNLQELRKNYADMSAGLADQVQLLRIYEFASPDTTSVVESTMVSVVLAGVAGLLISIATIVMLAYFDERLVWHEGLETVQGVKVLGPLGVVPKNKLPLYLVSMPDEMESEVIRQLRAKLVLAAGGVPPKVLTITSYDTGDGKTVTASNLALAFAQSGLDTLIVDGDIRKGDLHEVFRLPNVMGLSDILAAHDDIPKLLSGALLDSGYDHLTVLTSGRSNADPASLLSSVRFPQVMDMLKTQFDVIVMDSVPTIGGPDAAFLAEVSDGVLMIADSRRTTTKGIKRTLQALQQASRVNLYGIAFNRVYLQVSGTYNKPYYRHAATLNAERMSRELADAGKHGLRLNRHVITDQTGGKLFSLKAAAIQLGISEDTMKNWIKVGYLTTVRKGRRQWIRESEMHSLLERLPRHQIARIGETSTNGDHVQETNGVKSTTDVSLPGLLRDQRNALLDFVREPQPTEEADKTDQS